MLAEKESGPSAVILNALPSAAENLIHLVSVLSPMLWVRA